MWVCRPSALKRVTVVYVISSSCSKQVFGPGFFTAVELLQVKSVSGTSRWCWSFLPWITSFDMVRWCLEHHTVKTEHSTRRGSSWTWQAASGSTAKTFSSLNLCSFVSQFISPAHSSHNIHVGGSWRIRNSKAFRHNMVGKLTKCQQLGGEEKKRV